MFFATDLPGTPGFGSSPPALWFFPPSFETQPGLPAVRWTPHQTAGEKREPPVCLHAHKKEKKTRPNTQKGVRKRHGAFSQTAAGHINRHRKHTTLLSGRCLFIALQWPSSLFIFGLCFQPRLSCMLMDLTFAESEPCHCNDFRRPAGRMLGWWAGTLKNKT